MNDDWIGDDGELPPRKAKPIEGVSLRVLIVSILLTTVIAASIGAISVLIVDTITSSTDEQLAREVDTLRSTQVAVDRYLYFLSTQVSYTQSMRSAASRTPVPTLLPPDQCYCDNASCRPPNMVMRRGESLDTLGIQPSDLTEFGWYRVRNVNEISGVSFLIFSYLLD
jgi:hypothetical protein